MQEKVLLFNFNEETQKAILEIAGISDPKEANWDVFPITFIDIERCDDSNEQ